MNYQIDHNQFEDDLIQIKNFFFGLRNKPFDPNPKIINNKKIGVFENLQDRVMITLVELGPMKIFKTLVVTIAMILVYVYIFSHADVFFKIVSIVFMVFFYAWVFLPELKLEMAALDKSHQTGTAHFLVGLNTSRSDTQGAILPAIGTAAKGTVTGIGSFFSGLFGGGAAPAKPADKPKA